MLKPPDTSQRRFRLSRSTWTWLVIAAVLLFLHSCGALPTSRNFPRSYILPRDYRDMKAIFQAREIPESFKITAIQHPFGNLPGDGPGPVKYKATVAGSDYPALVRGLGEKQDPLEASMGRDLAALYAFEREKYVDFLESFYAEEGDPDWESRRLAEYFESPRAGGYHHSSILCDVTTSDPVTLYITTYFPYEGR